MEKPFCGSLSSRITNVSERTEIQQLRVLVKTLMEQNFQLMEKIDLLISPIANSATQSQENISNLSTLSVKCNSESHHPPAVPELPNGNLGSPHVLSYVPEEVQPFLGDADLRTPIQFVNEFERSLIPQCHDKDLRVYLFGHLLRNECRVWLDTRKSSDSYEQLKSDFLKYFWAWDRQYAECQKFKASRLEDVETPNVQGFVTHWMSRLNGNELISLSFVVQLLITKLPFQYAPILMPFIHNPVLSEMQKTLLHAEEYLHVEVTEHNDVTSVPQSEPTKETHDRFQYNEESFPAWQKHRRNKNKKKGHRFQQQN